MSEGDWSFSREGDEDNEIRCEIHSDSHQFLFLKSRTRFLASNREILFIYITLLKRVLSRTFSDRPTRISARRIPWIEIHFFHTRKKEKKEKEIPQPLTPATQRLLLTGQRHSTDKAAAKKNVPLRKDFRSRAREEDRTITALCGGGRGEKDTSSGAERHAG